MKGFEVEAEEDTRRGKASVWRSEEYRSHNM